MTIEIVRGVLGWCAVINMAALLYWFLMVVLAHDLVYRIHNRMFKVPVETFNVIHYSGILFLKIIIFVFFIIPYFALLIVT